MQRKQELENELGFILRLGVVLAAAVVVLGGAVYLVRYGFEPPAYHAFRGPSPGLNTIPGILAGAAQFRGRGVIQFGLVLLIATPITRVALSGYYFFRHKDWLYVAVSAMVLALLLYGLVTGR